jgi:hypothetical protein
MSDALDLQSCDDHYTHTSGAPNMPQPLVFNPNATPEERWADNQIQFMRLLGECASALELTPTQMATLCEVMDLEEHQVLELLERAQAAWDQYKASMP